MPKNGRLWTFGAWTKLKLLVWADWWAETKTGYSCLGAQKIFLCHQNDFLLALIRLECGASLSDSENALFVLLSGAYY